MKASRKTTKKKSGKKSDPLARDLSHLFDSSGWKKMRFELKPKTKSITIRMNEGLLEAIKAKAEKEGLDYQKWIREALEDALLKSA